MSQNMSRDSMVYASEEAPSPAPAPLQQVVMGETIPDIDMKIRESEFKMKGELIQLRNKVLKLEIDVGMCCPDYDKLASKIQSRVRGIKDRTEMTQKYPEVFNKPPEIPEVTKGWIVIKGGSAFSGNTGPLSGRRNVPVSVFDRRKTILGMGLVGFSMRNGWGGMTGTDWWPRDQTNDPNIMLVETIKEHHTDQHIAPGVSFELIQQKMKEGFEIEFEDEGERLAAKFTQFAPAFGKHRGGKKRSKKKRSKKKRSKKKRSKKYSRRNIKSNRKKNKR